METNQLRAIEVACFFLFIFLSGFWLGRSEKPYPSLTFNIHKLIGLAAGVFLIITVNRLSQESPLISQEVIAILVTVLCFIALVIAGGLISIENPMPVIFSLVHKVFPYITVLSTSITLYLLISHR
jgi:hypothetical protein